MGVILTALFAVISANALWELLSILVSRIVGEKEKDMSDKYVTLDEFINERGDFVKQIVYKVDGDFNGDIKGENVTVILMGNGDFKGDINSKDGTVFLNKGNVIGDIKANKVLCPTNEPLDKSPNVPPTCHSCKYYSSYDNYTYYYYCEKLKDNFRNPYNTCGKYVERT